jgi:hypothetical protein
MHDVMTKIGHPFFLQCVRSECCCRAEAAKEPMLSAETSFVLAPHPGLEHAARVKVGDHTWLHLCCSVQSLLRFISHCSCSRRHGPCDLAEALSLHTRITSR